jgi:hypothetical protein
LYYPTGAMEPIRGYHKGATQTMHTTDESSFMYRCTAGQRRRRKKRVCTKETSLRRVGGEVKWSEVK